MNRTITTKESAVLAASIGLMALRVLLTATMFAALNPAATLLCAISVWALCATGVAWVRGVPDLTWRGLGVGVAYLAVMVLEPGHPVLWVQCTFWAVVAVQVWTRAMLGLRCTVTGPVFASVERRGPYRFVRHPMTAAEMLLATCIVLENPTVWNLNGLAFVVVCKMTLVVWEERFLGTFPEYREYAQEVKWRMVPCVW